MFVICVSSSSFILLMFMYLWHCECVIKCSYLAWMQCKYFKNHLQPFWNAIQNAKICWEAFVKGETLNYCVVAFQIYCYNDVFNQKLSTIQYEQGKIRSNCCEECEKLIRYQTKYLVRTFIFIILHSVFIMLYIKSYSFVSLLIPSSPNVVSRPQTWRSWNFLRFYNFIGFILLFWRKWGFFYENCS